MFLLLNNETNAYLITEEGDGVFMVHDSNKNVRVFNTPEKAIAHMAGITEEDIDKSFIREFYLS